VNDKVPNKEITLIDEQGVKEVIIGRISDTNFPIQAFFPKIRLDKINQLVDTLFPVKN